MCPNIDNRQMFKMIPNMNGFVLSVTEIKHLATTLVNVYIDLLVLTRIAGTS